MKFIGSPYDPRDVFGAVDRGDLRLPGDALILYYLFRNGAGTRATIAETIDRKDNYVGQRISALEDPDRTGNRQLVTRVGGDRSEVTLTLDGADVARKLPERFIEDYREAIDAATPYSVSWDGA